jgi:hypothetical protein
MKTEVSRMPGVKKVPAFLVLLAVAGVIGAACGGGGAAGSATGLGIAAATPAPRSGESRLSAGSAGPTKAGDLQLTSVGPKIIKTASISLEIKDQTFEQRAQEAILVASRHGGFVTSSRTSGQKHLSGTMVIRVPASQFELALSELKNLGTLTGEQIAGEDVTAQFVDLEARLRNWEAQEAVLLKLMARSTSIEDSLKVQQSLQDVQLAIQQIKGQLRLITDQTDMSTINLSMAERPAVVAPDRANAFVRAWRRGLDATGAVFTAIAIGLGFMAPLLLVALAAGLAWLVFRRLRPRAVATPIRR